MSLNIGAVQSRFLTTFPDIAKVDDTILRFTRSDGKTPYAVCFLDLGRNLPGTSKELEEYLERVVGESYFGQSRSLQWNHYLYFVVEDLATTGVQHSRSIIEHDPTYARKFVIEEGDLDGLLNSALLEPEGAATQVNIASQWASVLQQPHLIEAVFGTYSLPERMRFVMGEQSTPEPLDVPTAGTSQSVELLPPLREFHIAQFRPCLAGRKFSFGDVNLFFGVNGAGKTSALEAIELYYCGKRTKRNRNDSEEYRFQVQVEGEEVQEVTDDRSESVFRDRSRDWYGVREQRRSHLYDSFGRFNFLDTDAAIDLARSDNENANEHLSRLLVGSDAAMTWQVVESLLSRVALELKTTEQRQSQAVEELELLEKHLAEGGTVKTESTSLRLALQESLRRAQWTMDARDLEKGAGQLIEQLSSILGIAQQAVKLSWIDTPVTLEKCQQFLTSSQDFRESWASELERVDELKVRQAQFSSAISRNQQAAGFADELSRLIHAGVEQRASELSKVNGLLAEKAILLADIDDQTLALASDAAPDSSVAEAYNTATEARCELDNALKSAKQDSEHFVKARERAVTLGEQLRSLAHEIIGDSPADECPLCHTKFMPGDLLRHMNVGVDEHVEAAAQKLLAKVSQLEGKLFNAVQVESAIERILRYSNSSHLAPDVNISKAIASVQEATSNLQDARKSFEELNAESESLARQNLTVGRLSEVRMQLRALGYNETYLAADEAVQLRHSIDTALEAASTEAKATFAEIAGIQTTFENAIRPWRIHADQPKDALELLGEQRVTTERIQSFLVKQFQTFNWPNSKPIGEWIVEAESVQAIAAKLQSTLGEERVVAKTFSDSINRKEHLDQLIVQLSGRLERLKEAYAALTSIDEEYSIESVTHAALEKNRKGIEKIFAQIHSPQEFEGLGEEGWQLSRKTDGKLVPLTRISTGQRAAFALSVFLAQNAIISGGPRVILIDDPIAHIDDLNALSFLDYLREIAIAGERQIFFATANEKLASLFERKFDFLGARFHRHEFTHTDSP